MSAKARVREVLRRVGLEGDPVRAGSDANEVWLGPDFVVRINVRGPPGRLQREVRIAAALPPEALYPKILAHGSEGELGFEWVIAQRVAGDALSRIWPRLSPEERASAISQLGPMLRALHSVDPTGLPDASEVEGPHVLPLSGLEAQLGRLQGLLDPGLAQAIADRARSAWEAFDNVGWGLVHGDMHFGNVLWHEGEVTALLDFEWACVSWREVDLEIPLAFCADPAWFVPAEDEPDTRVEDWAEVPVQLEAAYPDLFSHPRLQDRLSLLAISRQLGHLVDLWPNGPEISGDARDRRQILRRLVG